MVSLPPQPDADTVKPYLEQHLEEVGEEDLSDYGELNHYIYSHETFSPPSPFTGALY